MPNHVINKLTIEESGTKLDMIFQTIKGEDTPIDFEKILPMPIHISKGDLSYIDKKESNGDNWYDWSISNWGTKWNSYDGFIESNVITFTTAWSCPLPIFIKLSEMFPNTQFSVEYADEDIGHNVGIIEIINGNIIEEIELSGTKDGLILATNIHYGGIDNYLEMYEDEDKEEILKRLEL